MADKKIIELQLIDEITDGCNFPIDDGIQTYRGTAPQLAEYMAPKLKQTIRAEADAGPTGAAGQLLAGHVAETDEFGVGTDLVHYKAKTGAPLVDEEGVYTLTDHNSVTVAGGIVGGSEGAWELNGTNQYLSNETLLETVPNTAINVLGYYKISDGIPTNNSGIFSKWNVIDSGDYHGIELVHRATLGYPCLSYGIGGTTIELYGNYPLTNGAQSDYLFFAACWDTTYGIRLYVGNPNAGLSLVASDPTQTTLFNDTGTGTQDFVIGARDRGTVDYFFGGRISQFRVVSDYVMTRKDIEKAFASMVEIDPVTSNTNFYLRAIVKENGQSLYTSEVKPQEVHRQADKVFLYGAQFKSTDKVTILGGMS